MSSSWTLGLVMVAIGVALFLLNRRRARRLAEAPPPALNAEAPRHRAAAAAPLAAAEAMEAAIARNWRATEADCLPGLPAAAQAALPKVWCAAEADGTLRQLRERSRMAALLALAHRLAPTVLDELDPAAALAARWTGARVLDPALGPEEWAALTGPVTTAAIARAAPAFLDAEGARLEGFLRAGGAGLAAFVALAPSPARAAVAAHGTAALRRLMAAELAALLQAQPDPTRPPDAPVLQARFAAPQAEEVAALLPDLLPAAIATEQARRATAAQAEREDDIRLRADIRSLMLRLRARSEGLDALLGNRWLPAALRGGATPEGEAPPLTTAERRRITDLWAELLPAVEAELQARRQLQATEALARAERDRAAAEREHAAAERQRAQAELVRAEAERASAAAPASTAAAPPPAAARGELESLRWQLAGLHEKIALHERQLAEARSTAERAHHSSALGYLRGREARLTSELRALSG